MSTIMAMLGVQFAGNMFGGMAGREQAKAQGRLTEAQNELNRANIEANNLVRDANNELSAAVGSLERFSQSLNNNRRLATLGREVDTIQTNLARAMRDLTSASLESRLDTAFELGSLAATASAAGVGGSSRDVMNATLRLTGARKQAAIQEQATATSYDAVKALTNTHEDAYAALDNSLILDQLDLSNEQFVPAFIEPVPSWGSTVTTATIVTVAQNPSLTQLALESQPSPQGGNSFMNSVNLRI